MSGRVLGRRYRLLEPLGAGGMAAVWTADDQLLQRRVAVKVLDLAGGDPSAARRFRREALVTARLAHPNVVGVYDAGVEDGAAFLVMELLPGPTLAQRLAAHGPLPVDEVLAIGAQIAAALAAAHQAGVVHRDLKPSNVAYATGTSVKVLDFGIARILEAAADPLTRTDTVIGTAAYLSPEQASGGPAGTRSDLYALGCLLFTLATGQPPFGGDSPLAVCLQHVNAPVPDLRAGRPDVPAGLALLVSQLLAKDPADRPQSATEVHRRLATLTAPPVWPAPLTATAVLPPRPAPPWPGSAPRRLLRRIRSTPRRRWLAGASLVAAAALIAALLALAGSGPRRAPAAASTRLHGAPSAAAGSTTPSTAPPTTPVPTTAPLTPAQAITGFSRAVLSAAEAGSVAPAAARDLLGRATDLLAALRAGQLVAAGRDVTDLAQRLNDLAASGQLTPAGEQVLAGPLAALEHAIPPQPAAGDQGPPRGHGGPHQH